MQIFILDPANDNSAYYEEINVESLARYGARRKNAKFSPIRGLTKEHEF